MSSSGKKPRLNTRQVVELIGQAAEAKQALDLKVLDVRKTSEILDYLIICSAESAPQLRAIEKEIDKSLRNNRIKGFRWQGPLKSGWLVLDLGAIVVHIMGLAERAYYNLEELWGKEAVVYHY